MSFESSAPHLQYKYVGFPVTIHPRGLDSAGGGEMGKVIHYSDAQSGPLAAAYFLAITGLLPIMKRGSLLCQSKNLERIGNAPPNVLGTRKEGRFHGPHNGSHLPLAITSIQSLLEIPSRLPIANSKLPPTGPTRANGRNKKGMQAVHMSWTPLVSYFWCKFWWARKKQCHNPLFFCGLWHYFALVCDWFSNKIAMVFLNTQWCFSDQKPTKIQPQIFLQTFRTLWAKFSRQSSAQCWQSYRFDIVPQKIWNREWCGRITNRGNGGKYE